MEAAQRYNSSLVRLLLSNALIKSIWILGIDRWVQNEVGMLAYGEYFSVWGLTITAGFLLDMGLSTMVRRERANQRAPESALAGTFWLKGSLLLVYFLAIAIIGWLNGQFFTNWFWGVAIIQALNSFYVYLRAWVTATQAYTADVWFSVLDKGLLIPVCALWLAGYVHALSITLDTFILLQIASLGISIGMVWAYLNKKQIHFMGPLSFSVERIRAAFPYAIIVLLMSAHTRLDGFLLSHWSASGILEAGRYAAGYRLLDAANMFGYLVSSFLLPYVSRHLTDTVPLRSAIGMARNGLILFSMSLIGFLFFFAGQVSDLLYANDPSAVADILPILFGSILGYSLIHVYGTVLTARGSLRLFQVVIALAFVGHLVLAFIWIPPDGAVGAARSALVSQVFAGLTLMYLVHQRMGLKQPHTSYLVVIFTCLLVWFFA